MAKGKSQTEQRMTLFLIAINVIVFLLVFSAPEQVREGTFERYSLSQATAFQLWRWVTSMFLHASASHLFFNMLGLYFFGRIVEGETNAQWFLSIYFVGGFLGSLSFLLTSPSPVVGASAGIFSLMGTAMLLKPLEKVSFYVFPLPLGIVALMFTVAESLVAYYQPGFGNIAHVAHIGGLITGSVFAFAKNPKKAGKGFLLLVVMGAVLLIISPFIAVVTGAGEFILWILEGITGFFLYGLAWLLSFLWM
ncbi:MAG: rhomboid family intramembrane serine protease [Candidatus Aenigmatarchaeota archaeon]